jgi:hypothetical protein
MSTGERGTGILTRLHVEPFPTGWGVFLSGELVDEAASPAEAELAARAYLLARRGGEIVLHLGAEQPPKVVAVSK